MGAGARSLRRALGSSVNWENHRNHETRVKDETYQHRGRRKLLAKVTPLLAKVTEKASVLAPSWLCGQMT